MATNEPVSLFSSAEEPDQRGIGRSGHRAVIASGILLLTGTAIVLTVLFAGNQPVLFADITASVAGTSAPQDGTAHSTPIIQSTAESQSLPPAASDAPTSDEIAGAVKTASETEIRVPPAEALFREFQAWAAGEDARAQVQQVEPIQPLEATQDAQSQDDVQNARAEVRPAQKRRHVRSEPDTRTQMRPMKNARAQVRSERQAREPRPKHNAQPMHHERVQIRAEQRGQNTQAQDRPGENTWALWPDRVFGWLR
jgi:hypothetical protein